MKKAIVLLAIGMLAGISGLVGYSNGAPAGRTGSPGDGSSCASSGCHSQTPATASGLISTNIPATGYVPGTTYTITASISHATRNEFGFQVSPQNATGSILGTLIVTNSTQTKLVGSGGYITHKSAGTAGSGNAKSWSFNWTAPSAGTGAVTFYGAFNSSNNNNGSSGDLITLSNTTVQEALPLSVSYVFTDPSCYNVCDGAVQLTISGGTAPYTVSWNGGSPSSTTQFTNLCDGTYTYDVYDADSAHVSGTIQLTAPIKTPLDLIVVGGDTSFCTGDTAFMESSAGFTEYLWSDGSNTQNVATQQAGTWYLQATDPFGCVTFSDTVELVEVLPPPIPTITQNGPLLSTDQAAGYQWFINGLPITNGINQNFFVTVNGVYVVQVFNSEGCMSQSDPYVVTNAGIEDLSSSVELSLFPNPAREFWGFEPALPPNTVITVIDLSGRIVWEDLLSMETEKILIPSELANGTYWIRLDKDGQHRNISSVVYR
jgi:hypothetical protein